MKWTLQQLEAEKETGLSFEETVDVSDLREADPEIREISPVQVTGHAWFEDRKIIFALQIFGKMVLPSSKTLEDVDYPIHLQATEVFRLDSGVEEDGEEEILHDIEHDTVDLLPFVKEAILADKPIRVANEDEKPLASGNGWTLVSESERQNRVDPRLAKLAEFLEENND
ncbi:MAG TPA: YceD family protein [Bacillales bacterium]|nr:YceD family protein [Bacillales bacterium]